MGRPFSWIKGVVGVTGPVWSIIIPDWLLNMKLQALLVSTHGKNGCNRRYGGAMNRISGATSGRGVP
jgi:hypothetical protein